MSPSARAKRSQAAPDIFAAVNVCNYCNHRCVYCKEGRREGEAYRAQTLPEIKRAIARLVVEKKITAVMLMGGETALRPDFLELLKFIRRLGLVARFGTNLTRFSDPEFLAACAPYVSYLEVSVPAVTEKEYGLITRSKNYGEFLRGAANVGRAGIPLTVNVVLTKYAAAQTGRILAFAKKTFRGLRTVTFKVPNLKGSALEHRALMCAPEEAVRAVRPWLRKPPRGLKLMIEGAPLCLLRGLEEYSNEAFVAFNRRNRDFCVNNRSLIFDMPFHGREPAFPECRACRLAAFCCVPPASLKGLRLSNRFDEKLLARKFFGRFAPLERAFPGGGGGVGTGRRKFYKPRGIK